MFTFPIMLAHKGISRGEQDAAANGGFRNPYYGARSSEGEKPFVVNSNECHLKGNDDWWDYKRRHFGDDDCIEFIDSDLVVPSFDRNFVEYCLGILLTEHHISSSMITR